MAATRATKAGVRRELEADVVSACLEYAAMRGVVLERRNVMQADFDGRKVRAGRKGDPDYEGNLADGRRICWEAKAPGKRPRPEQVARMQELIRGGAQAWWSDDLGHFRKVLDALLAGARIEAESDGARGPVLAFPEAKEVQS